MITATHDYQDSGETDGYVGDEKVKAPALHREELWELYRPFGPDEAIAVHRESMSYIVQLAEGYRLFALNDDSKEQGRAVSLRNASPGLPSRRARQGRRGSLSSP